MGDGYRVDRRWLDGETQSVNVMLDLDNDVADRGSAVNSWAQEFCGRYGLARDASGRSVMVPRCWGRSSGGAEEPPRVATVAGWRPRQGCEFLCTVIKLVLCVIGAAQVPCS